MDGWDMRYIVSPTERGIFRASLFSQYPEDSYKLGLNLYLSNFFFLDTEIL